MCERTDMKPRPTIKLPPTVEELMLEAGICRATAERRIWRYNYGFSSYEDMFVSRLRTDKAEREAENRLIAQQYRRKQNLLTHAERQSINRVLESLEDDAQDIGSSRYRQNLRWELKDEANGGVVIEQIYGMPTPKEVYSLCMAGEPGAGQAILNDDDELTAYRAGRGENAWKVVFCRASAKRRRERERVSGEL